MRSEKSGRGGGGVVYQLLSRCWGVVVNSKVANVRGGVVFILMSISPLER